MGKHTPGPWGVFNMVHSARKTPMTPEEIGEYVANSVRQSVKDGGSLDRFLFIADANGDGPDICHIGNGPNGQNNARLIAVAPLMLKTLRGCVEAFNMAMFEDTPALQQAKEIVAAFADEEN